PYEQILKLSGLPIKEVNFRLERLSEIALIRRWVGSYEGYTLNRAGYDCLALNTLVKRGSIEAFGMPIGVGKESGVYEALNSNGVRVAVKFHRLGSISFRNVVKLRSYVRNKRYTSWLILSRVAAEREFQALKLTYHSGVSVPKPIDKSRHVVVMSIIEGTELENLTSLQNPEYLFKEVIENVRKTYLEAKIIHADLSGFNILIKPNRHILIIDWPQYVSINHPNAETLLERDVKNVVNLFKRKFNFNASLEEVLRYVRGK
ncbi:MAG: RIO1 family regulatory kinase/ATPase, partial [Candidatus Bathyarchaeia archaeon]